jgi:hypothetical protein
MAHRNPRVFLTLAGVLLSLALTAYTPEEVFQDGRRQFLLGNWYDAVQHLERFLDKWPDHDLAPEALYFQTLAEARDRTEAEKRSRENRLASLTQILEKLTKDFPDRDFTEINSLIIQTQSELGTGTASLTFPLTATPDFMRQALIRRWFPGHLSPISTLEWIHSWKTGKKTLPNDVKSQLELVRAKALWRFVLSPLPTQTFFRKLRLWGEWPVGDALHRSLKVAFTTGDHRTKREAALIGVSFAHILEKKGHKSLESSEYHTYLSSHGIYSAEAWCPNE